MIRRCIFVVILLSMLLAALSHVALAQSGSATVSYDLSTIKPHKPGDGNSSVSWHEATYEASNVSLQHLIASAFGIRDWLIFGLPPWADAARYDIQAKVSDSDRATLKKLSIDQRRAMLATLLKERFGLIVHTESKVQPVYELSVQPGGIKIEPTPAPAVPADGTTLQKPGSRWSIHNGALTATAMTMPTLCDNLSYQVERFIVDRTGLTGMYDFTLTWTPEDKLGNAADNGLTGDAPPAIYTAIRDQLGLKLTPSKAPVPTLVIDHVEQPAAN